MKIFFIAEIWKKLTKFKKYNANVLVICKNCAKINAKI